jgi:tetrahydromethanopterin S-methyltransferase subunit G
MLMRLVRDIALAFAVVIGLLVVIDGTLLANLFKRE